HLAFARHEEDAGRERLENALAQFRSTRTLRSAEGCKALLTYGELMSRQSRTARAQRILLEVAQAAQRQDLTLILGRAQLGLARVLVRMGKLAEAQREAKTALALAEEHRDLVQKARCLVTLADVAKAQRRWKQAVDQLEEAVELFKRTRQTAEFGAAARELGM